MEKAKVYFTDFRTSSDENLLQKLKRLMATAGMDTIDFTNKYVAIKLHFGEPGNLAYVRPNYVRAVAEFIKDLGGKPFLTDCNTLYVGGRKNAVDHMMAAEMNGFNTITTGCPVIIGDGLKGTDDVEVPIVGGQYLQTARIGRAVMDADIVISLNHRVIDYSVFGIQPGYNVFIFFLQCVKIYMHILARDGICNFCKLVVNRCTLTILAYYRDNLIRAENHDAEQYQHYYPV